MNILKQPVFMICGKYEKGGQHPKEMSILRSVWLGLFGEKPGTGACLVSCDKRNKFSSYQSESNLLGVRD